MTTTPTATTTKTTVLTTLLQSPLHILHFLLDFQVEHLCLGTELCLVSVVEFPHAVDLGVGRRCVLAAAQQLLLTGDRPDHLVGI